MSWAPTVVAVGVVSAVGLTAAATAAAVRASIAAFAEFDGMVDARGDRAIVARVPRADLPVPLGERIASMAVDAAEQALAGRSLASAVGLIPIFVAIPALRPGLGQRFRHDVSAAFDALAGSVLGPTAAPIWIEGGHCAGLQAIASGIEQLRSGMAGAVLVGAVDSYLTPQTLWWLEQTGELHGAANPFGLIPGEAAAFALLERGPANSLHASDGSTLLIDACMESAPAALTDAATAANGTALAAVINRCLEMLPPGAVVDDILCDMNGQRDRAKDYAFALPKFADRCRDAVDFRVPADCVGDVGAASGLLLVALAFEAVRKGYAHGRHQLVWTRADDGTHAALLAHASIH